jgi:CMP-N,N'-diacetyllegionaminic acid synthase
MKAIILARSGSKGLENKNIKKIGGLTLIDHSIYFLQKEKKVDEIILSSDSSLYLRMHEERGVTLHKRSSLTSNDKASSVDALTEVLESCVVNDKENDFIALVEPTFIFRKQGILDRLYINCVEENCDSGVTVTKLPMNPNYIFKKHENKLQKYIENCELFTRRQQFEEIMCLASGIYITKISNILTYSRIIGDDCGYLEVDCLNINIDTIADFKIARLIYEASEW